MIADITNLAEYTGCTRIASQYAKDYFAHLNDIFGKLDMLTIGKFSEKLLQAREAQKNIFFIGNGGSAATASHFANDLGFGTRTLDKPFRAQSLTDNAAVITAIGNDYGYDNIFTFQLQNQLQEGDTVVAISASGNSKNVLDALRYAKDSGAYTIGLTGFDGGAMADLVDLNVHIPTKAGEYGPVEDVHMILDHLVTGFITQYIHRQNQS